jgi:hypothetical protein
LIRLRISPVISPGSVANTRAAITVWKSMPERKASIRPWSSDRCAMIRISIWL